MKKYFVLKLGSLKIAQIKYSVIIPIFLLFGSFVAQSQTSMDMSALLKIYGDDMIRVENIEAPDLTYFSNKEEITLGLFTDVIITAKKVKSVKYANNYELWRGKLINGGDGYLELFLRNGLIVGTVYTESNVYKINGNADGFLRVIELNRAEISDHLDEKEEGNKTDIVISGKSLSLQSSNQSAQTSDFSRATATNPTIVTIMILYPSSVENAVGGSLAMDAEVNYRIAEANEIFSNSNIYVEFRLVHHQVENSIDEDADSSSDIRIDEVEELRDQYKADLVSHWNEDGATGSGSNFDDFPGEKRDGFNTSNYGAIQSQYTFVHECGHNMGAKHDRQDYYDANNSKLDLGVAYRYGKSFDGYRSIMSYNNCDQAGGSSRNCDRVPYFTNPDIIVNGDSFGVTGTDQTYSPNGPSDNARRINEVAPYVAAYYDNDDELIIDQDTGTDPEIGDGSIDVTISNTNDDAEEAQNGEVYLDSSDLELVYDSFDDSGNQVVGLRFRSLALPKNVTITSAYIQFNADESDSEDAELEIALHNSSNSPEFTSSINDISDRVLFSNTVIWDPNSWTSGDNGTSQRSPDLTSMVQQLVNNNDWSSGNNASFIIRGSGVSLTNTSAKRVAVSYDGDSDNAARLIVNYDVDDNKDSDSDKDNDSYTSIPTLIQAEDFNTQSGMQTESTSDNGGGENVGYIDTEDFLTYNINVPSSADYTISFRISSKTNGTSFDIYSGSSIIGNISSAATGGWQVWETVSETVSLNEGDQTLRLVATGNGWNINWLNFSDADLSFEDGSSSESDSSSCKGTNLSLSSTIVDFSDQQNMTNNADNSIDGNDSNRWSVFGFSQYIILDLGEEYSINEINLLTYQDRAYQFIVEGATSSVTNGFSTLVDATNNTGNSPINKTFSAQTVRYVKLTVLGANNYDGSWVSIHDFEVICAGSTSNKDIFSTIDNNAFSVIAYPNPFTSIINVEANNTSQVIGNVQLLDLSGKIIISQLSASGIEASLENLDVANGIYLLQIFNTRNQIIKVIKMIKEKK